LYAGHVERTPPPPVCPVDALPSLSMATGHAVFACGRIVASGSGVVPVGMGCTREIRTPRGSDHRAREEKPGSTRRLALWKYRLADTGSRAYEPRLAL